MKDKILEQIGKELKLAAWLDMVVLIVGVGITLTLFSVASIFAANTVGSVTDSLMGGIGGLGSISASFNTTPTIIMFICLAVIFIISWYGVKVLLKNKARRVQMNEGLVKLYKDEGMEQYSDAAIYKSYEARYNLFAVIMGAVGFLSFIVPLIIFIDNLTKL